MQAESNADENDEDKEPDFDSEPNDEFCFSCHGTSVSACIRWFANGAVCRG